MAMVGRLPRQLYATAQQLADALWGLEVDDADDLVWDDETFPTNGINPPGAASDPSRNATTGLLQFSASQQNIIAGVAQFKHRRVNGTPIRPHVHFFGDAAPGAAPVVTWQLEWRWVNNYDGVPATYRSETINTAIMPYDALSQPILQIGVFPEISGVGKTESSHLFWRVSRMGNAASDTYASTVTLGDFDVHFQTRKSRAGSQKEWGDRWVDTIP